MKRFVVEPARDPVLFISEHPDSRPDLPSLVDLPRVHVSYDQRSAQKADETIMCLIP